LPDVSGFPPAAANQILEQYYDAYPSLRPRTAEQTRCPAGLVAYAPGGTTVLGGAGAPNTFGTELMSNPDGQAEEIPRVMRVVWHYSAFNEVRTFTIVYRAHGWVKRSADGSAVILRATPWGSEWDGSLGQLRGVVRLPKSATATPDQITVYGAGRGASSVRNIDPLISHDGVAFGLTGTDIAPGERVELLATIPADESGVSGGLPTDDQPAENARDAGKQVQGDSRDREQLLDTLAKNRVALILLAAIGSLLLAGLWVYFAWSSDMKEIPWPEDVDRILSDPPSELQPALAVSLVEQRERAAPTALVATIFDLIRRDFWKVLPAQSNEKGAEVDIALAPAPRPEGMELTTFESQALSLVDHIIDGDENGIALGAIKSKLGDDLMLSRKISSDQSSFESSVKDAVAERQWLQPARTRLIRWPRVLALLVLVASIVGLCVGSMLAWNIGSDPRIVAIVLSVTAVASTGVFIALALPATSRLLKTRWRAEARSDAARWTAYRDFLDRYGDMGDEQTASIEIWERHLVYAIAFGCAEDILNAVRPEGASDLADSSLGSFNPGYYATFSNGISTRAPEPSSSGSSSFGGGGGGFSGGGGGGGGAW
jgi:uncharacterized membrane protein YgcG